MGDSIFDLVNLSGSQGLSLFKTQKKGFIKIDLKFIDLIIRKTKKKKRIFKISNQYPSLKTKIWIRWEFLRRQTLGLSVLNSLNLSNLGIQILNEIGKSSFIGIPQHELGQKLNLKPSYIYHQLNALKKLNLIGKMFYLNKKSSKISNPVLLIVKNLYSSENIKEKQIFPFQFFSRQNESKYINELVNIVSRQERNIGQKNLKYGILYNNDKFKNKDKKKIHRIWQKLRERLVKSNILFGEKKSSKKPNLRKNFFWKISFIFIKKSKFSTSFSYQNFFPRTGEIRSLFKIPVETQVQEIIQKNPSKGVNFPFLIDKLKGQINYKTLHSIIRNFESFRSLIRKFDQIGKQRIINFTIKASRDSKTSTGKKIIDKKNDRNETDQVSSRRLLLLSWVKSHLLVLKDLGRKIALFEKKGLKRVDSKVIGRILSDLIKSDSLKILKIRVRLGSDKVKDIEFVTRKNFNSFHIKKLIEPVMIEKYLEKKKERKTIKRFGKKNKVTFFWNLSVPRSLKKVLKKKPFFSIYTNFKKKKDLFFKIQKGIFEKFFSLPIPIANLFKNRFFYFWFKKKKDNWTFRPKKKNFKKNKKILEDFPKNQKLESKRNWVKKSLAKNFQFGKSCGEKRKFFSKRDPDPFFSQNYHFYFIENYLNKKSGLFSSRGLKILLARLKIFKLTAGQRYSRKKIPETTKLVHFFPFSSLSFNRWDCEADVKLFQLSLFDEKMDQKSLKKFLSLNSKPFFRRLKGIINLENTKLLKFYFRKCFRIFHSYYLSFFAFDFFHLTKRCLEFPANYFSFHLESITHKSSFQQYKKTKKKINFGKITLKDFYVFSFFFPTVRNLEFQVIHFLALLEKIWIFFFHSNGLLKFLNPIFETFWLNLLGLKPKTKILKDHLNSFNDQLKIIDCLPKFNLTKTFFKIQKFSRFFSEINGIIFFFKIEEKKNNVFPLILKNNSNFNMMYNKRGTKKFGKVANFVEIRIKKKKKFYKKLKPFLKWFSFQIKKNRHQKPPKRSKIFQIFKNQSFFKLKPGIFQFFLSFFLKSLTRFFDGVDFICLKFKVFRRYFPIHFFSKKFLLRDRFSGIIKSSEKNFHYLGKKSKFNLQGRFLLKTFLMIKIITNPGKEVSSFDFLIETPSLRFNELYQAHAWLFFEKKIYQNIFLMKKWKFSSFFFETISMSSFLIQSKLQKALGFSFPTL